MVVDSSAQSKQDVLAITRYIAQDNIDAALRFIDRVEETYAQLVDFPLMGHTPSFIDIYVVAGLKTILVKGFSHYHIFYRVIGDRIRIERVADGRRDMPSLFAYLEGLDG